MHRLAITPTVNPGRYIVQKKKTYDIVRSEDYASRIGKELIASLTIEIITLPSLKMTQIEGSSLELARKKQKVEENIVSGDEIYTPTQAPLYLESKKITLE